MKTCTQCVLPENFPRISFDGNGVCNYCTAYNNRQSDNLAHKKQTYKDKFEALLQTVKGNSTYDAIMCYSGGKDSTYALMILRQQYNLNMLAITMDNGFLPQQTYANIRNATESLDVDHIFLKPRFGLLRQIFAECARTNIYPAKTLERASTICTSCMAIVKFSVLRFALEKDIPMIAYGWSPGQAPVTSSVVRNTPAMLKVMQEIVFNPLYHLVGKPIEPYFLKEKHFVNRNFRFPYNISPLMFLDYNEEDIIQYITPLGWKRPQDTDGSSSNCLLNCYANMIHKQQFGYHPYIFAMANMVREGNMSRSAALDKLYEQENPETISAITAKLGLTPVCATTKNR